MFLKEQDIETHIINLNLTPEPKSAIWGTTKPSTLNMVMFGSAAILDLKYNIIYFTENEIIIIGVSNITGKIMDDEHLILPRKDIQSIIFKKKLLNYELEIKTSEGALKFKINNKMVGAKWHGENLESILSAEN